MTELKFWYQTQSANGKNAFKTQVISLARINEKTFYKYLNQGAPKLVINLLSQLSQLDKSLIYKNK